MLRIGVPVLIVAIIGFVFFLRWTEPEPAPTSLVFMGGTIATLADPAVVDAMWVHDGRIRALGGVEEVRELAGKGASVFDLRGATLMPGLIPHASNTFDRLE